MSVIDFGVWLLNWITQHVDTIPPTKLAILTDLQSQIEALESSIRVAESQLPALIGQDRIDLQNAINKNKATLSAMTAQAQSEVRNLAPADNYIYEKPYKEIGSAKGIILPKLVLGKVLAIGNRDLSGDALDEGGLTPFQPQDRFSFSPLPSNPYTLEGLALLGIIANFARTPSGQRSLERLAVKYLDTIGGMIESIQNASHSNWLTALNNQHLTAGMLHRLGLFSDGAYLKTIDHYRSVFNKLFVLGAITDTLSGVSTLVQGSKTTSQTAAGVGQAHGGKEEASGLATLASLIGKVAP